LPAFEAFIFVVGAAVSGWFVPPLFGVAGLPRLLIAAGLVIPVLVWLFWDMRPRHAQEES
jgi:hypothetical protein